MTPADLPLLDDLRVAAPCHAQWEEMTGDDRARFCASCRKTVYDLSDLTRAEALALVTRPGEAPCVRFFRRHDGTILTADCPVGLVARANRWRRRAVAATLALLAGAGGVASALRPKANPVDRPIAPNPAQLNPVIAADDGDPAVDPNGDDSAVELVSMADLSELVPKADSALPAPLDVASIVDDAQTRISDDFDVFSRRHQIQATKYLPKPVTVSLGISCFRPAPPAAPASPPPPRKVATPTP